MNNKILSSFNQIETVSYDKIVEEKSFLAFRLINIPESIFIEKRDNFIFINNFEYNISDISIAEVFNLILESNGIIEILYFTEDIDFILETSALFLQDFSSKKFIKTDIILSPIDMKIFKEHSDQYNNEYVLVDTKVFNFFKAIPFKLEADSLYLEDKGQSNYMLNEYRARELNIALLQEFPINNISDVYMYNYQSYLREDLHAF